MHISDPVVSVALCTYNGEKFIAEQLESILSQTYHNLEIIAVDDNSTDSTISILNDYAAKDCRLKVFSNETNLGFNKNFEKAINLSSGEFIAISDQDDVWMPEKIRILKESILDHWLIFSNSLLMDENGREIPGQLLTDFDSTKVGFRAFLLKNLVTGHTTLMHRSFIEYICPLPEGGYYDWWMGFIASYHRKLLFFNEPLTIYRVHEKSVMQTASTCPEYYFEKQSEQLAILSKYDRLDHTDKDYINKLLSAFTAKKNGFSIKLFNLILSNYSQLFANDKPRGKISLLNFAFKYSQRSQMKKAAKEIKI